MAAAATGATILLVDDEENLRHTLALILGRAGYCVSTAESVDEARQHLQAGPFDLVFLDLRMPGTGGLVLLRELRDRFPQMPVLILTAHATLDSAIEAVRCGARDYLLKPFDPPQLLARVEEILAENEPARRQRVILSEIQGLLDEWKQITTNRSHKQETDFTLDPARFLQRGAFTIDLHARYATLAGKRLCLSPTAFDYLVTLLRHSPNPVPYDVLVLESQGYQSSIAEAREMARWRIHELRKALEPNPQQPQYIITVRSVGYRLIT